MKEYGLSAFEKLKSRKDFEKIFTGGLKIYSSENKIRANYMLTTGPDNPGVMFAVAVGKNLGNAVWRNRAKRLIREAYRWNKHPLVEICKIKNALLKIIFSPQSLNQVKNKNIYLCDIEPPVIEIISKLKEKI